METDIQELEQIRKEYDALKSRFDRQQILNDRLIRETTKSKVGSIKRIVATDLCCALFVIATAPFAFHYNPVMNASWAFVGGTVLLMTVCIFFNLRYNKELYRTDLSSCDLLSFSKKAAVLKDKYKGWIKYGIIMEAVWFTWLCAEVLTRSADRSIGMLVICGLIAGLVTGGIIGLSMNRKVVRTCDDIIRQIEMN